VRIMHRPRHRRHKGGPLRGGAATTCRALAGDQQLSQAAAFQQLHAEIRTSFMIACVVDRHEVGVIEVWRPLQRHCGSRCKWAGDAPRRRDHLQSHEAVQADLTSPVGRRPFRPVRSPPAPRSRKKTDLCPAGKMPPLSSGPATAHAPRFVRPAQPRATSRNAAARLDALLIGEERRQVLQQARGWRLSCFRGRQVGPVRWPEASEDDLAQRCSRSVNSTSLRP